MQDKKWMLGAVALSLTMTAPTLVQAQPAQPAASTQTTEAKPVKLKSRTKASLEAMFGTTLTPAQEATIAAAEAEKSAAENDLNAEEDAAELAIKITMLETIFGAKLTPEQINRIEAAEEQREAAEDALDEKIDVAEEAVELAYLTKVATTMGTTVEDYQARIKAQRDRERAEKEARKAAEANN